MTPSSCPSSSASSPRRRPDSDVEEDRLVVALQADVEAVDGGAGGAAPIEPLGNEGLAALLPLDQVEHRVVGVGVGLVAEVDPRVEADVDAARDDPGVDMRRHDATVAALDRPRLDRVEGVDAALEIGAGAAPAAKARVDRLARLAVAGVRVLALRVGLPDLDQHVLQHGADAVEDAALDADLLALGLLAREDVAEVLREDVEAGRMR